MRLSHATGYAALLGALVCSGGALAQVQAQTQGYPNKPIRIISTGGADIVPRILGQKLTANLGQQVIVEERTGAGTTIGADFVARSAPDGYTILKAVASTMIAPNFYKIHYDTARDFAPITLAVTSPWVIAVHPSLPARSLAEFVRFAKAHPGQIYFSATTPGAASHLTMELFKLTAGINIVHVSYKTLAAAITDTIGGQVQAAVNIAPTAMPHIKSGRLRALAVSTLKRSAAAPELPTVAESGYPGFDSAGWYGFMAPAKTPAAIVATLNRELVAALRQPDVRERLIAGGMDPVGDTPQEFSAFVGGELEKWARVVKQANIKINAN
jgi:tripartite-type tricarboxylate transporter receptor subunit TctC